MTEHPFAASDPDDGPATLRALELTEAILEELTRADHDWQAINRMASALAQTASETADGRPASGGPHRAP